MELVRYCDIYKCSECPRYGDDCDGDFEEEEEMSWINVRTCEPPKDGTYLVQMTHGGVMGLDYTLEGGWNTHYDDKGELYADAAIASVRVARWLDAPTPPDVPQAWFDEMMEERRTSRESAR